MAGAHVVPTQDRYAPEAVGQRRLFFLGASSCFPSPFGCFVSVFNAKSSGLIVTCQSNSMTSANVLMKAEFV